MTRKQIILVVVLVLAASTLSALVAYRRGLRRSHAVFAPAPAGGGNLKCVDFREAGAYVGKTGCVSGRVLRVFASRAGNTFLDFCPDYRQCPFASVIFASDRSRFGDLGTLWGRQVEIRGPITTYQGRAEIIIHDPEQIRVLP